MKAKEFLKQLRKNEVMIRNKMIEKKQWEDIAKGTTARMDGERVQSSGSQQKMADAVVIYTDIEKEIVSSISDLLLAKNDVIKVIQQLPVDEYDILHKVYVQYFTLYDVAIMYDKTYSWATTVHGRALKNVQKILDERANNG